MSTTRKKRKLSKIKKRKSTEIVYERIGKLIFRTMHEKKLIVVSKGSTGYFQFVKHLDKIIYSASLTGLSPKDFCTDSGELAVGALIDTALSDRPVFVKMFTAAWIKVRYFIADYAWVHCFK